MFFSKFGVVFSLCVEQVNRLYNESRLHLDKNILHLTYAKIVGLGEIMRRA